MKTCTLCNYSKPLTEFYRKHDTKDGFMSRCKECVKLAENKEKTAARRKEYEKRPHVREYRRAYRRQRHVLDKVNEHRKQPEVKARRAKLARQRRMNDPKFAIHGRVSCMVRARIKARKENKSWVNILPYSLSELMRHLERQFTKGMGWHNIEEWEIDHIIPQSAFSFSSPEDPDFQACWALTNLRPLWSSENQSKRDKRLFLI